VWYRKRVSDPAAADVMTAQILGVLMHNKLNGPKHLASPYYDIEDVVRNEFQPLLGCDDPFESDSFEGRSYVCESLMMCLVRANMKEACAALWPNFTRITHERVVPDQAWRYCLYRTGDEATNQSLVVPPTGNWEELRKGVQDHAALDIPEALKNDPILLLLFANIFPFRASYSAIKFLHRKFDGLSQPPMIPQPEVAI
jgi:hypothetical protein